MAPQEIPPCQFREKISILGMGMNNLLKIQLSEEMAKRETKAQRPSRQTRTMFASMLPPISGPARRCLPEVATDGSIRMRRDRARSLQGQSKSGAYGRTAPRAPPERGAVLPRRYGVAGRFPAAQAAHRRTARPRRISATGYVKRYAPHPRKCSLSTRLRCGGTGTSWWRAAVPRKRSPRTDGR